MTLKELGSKVHRVNTVLISNLLPMQEEGFVKYYKRKNIRKYKLLNKGERFYESVKKKLISSSSLPSSA